MKKLILLSAVLAAFVLAGCASTTIRDKGTAEMAGSPTYQSSESFFLWGLVGTAYVDAVKVCKGKSPVQMQSQTTFVDGLLGAITLGIYSPKSAKVWCE